MRAQDSRTALIRHTLIILVCSNFKALKLPALFIRERHFLRPEDRPDFVRQATPFEDFVVRCVRYAFANISPKVGRVFFGRNVGLPWLRWRMLRHGYLKSPVHFREHRDVSFVPPLLLEVAG